ncbi:hypothetical protein FNB15_03265 [Ferrovibrio terrae]|uniref:Fatty acid desaturase domain-containing protein n=1 Tax=Ferrovibrio terrae TaxID=2594003 RepID=A0A516GXV9_9PROT|nr:fatty acid desaturase [Ferrovibrio terrae]QDO96356.1 hypothetical protein FNB15_03265 [Ferrovibrio terrae]
MGDRSQNSAGVTAEPTALAIKDYARRLSTLRNVDGLEYRQFRASLKPRYLVVWRDIGFGYGALVALIGGALWLPVTSVSAILLSAVLFGTALGYCLHYLSLFLHAASHYNLAADRTWNDRLATALFGLWFGYDIQTYRTVHFRHHAHLGTDRDPENSYIERLDLPFFLGALSGLRFLRKLAGTPAAKDDAGFVPGRPFPGFRLFSVTVHLLLVLVAALQGEWIFVLAWLGCWGIVFPLLTDLRLMLEHRPDVTAAATGIQDGSGPWAATSRMFVAGPISATFGGAGFDRHLLHHLEPSIPYERLADFEAFLGKTDLGAVLVGAPATYRRAFAALFGR